MSVNLIEAEIKGRDNRPFLHIYYLVLSSTILLTTDGRNTQIATII